MNEKLSAFLGALRKGLKGAPIWVVIVLAIVFLNLITNEKIILICVGLGVLIYVLGRGGYFGKDKDSDKQ